MLCSMYLAIHGIQGSPPVMQQYEGGLTVTAKRVIHRPKEQVTEWVDGVEAKYGPTVVTADRLLIHEGDEGYAQAVGHVRLVDPDGSIEAIDLTFSWTKHTGSGHSVAVRAGNLRLTASSIDVTPGLWTLRNVTGTGCSQQKPIYFVRTRELTIRPHVGGRAVKPEISILGHRLLTIPTHNFTFGQDNGSIDLPYPTWRSDRGFGVTWSNMLELDGQSGLFTRYASFQHAIPYYGASLFRSLVSGVGPLVPRSELGERLGFGYFDSVQVRSPDSEKRYLRDKRLDVGVQSIFGADAPKGTTESSKVNKPVELIATTAGEAGGFGLYGIARAQQIRIGSGPTSQRVILEGNVGTPTLRLSDALSVYGRGDLSQYFGTSSSGWIHGEMGLVFAPAPYARLGLSFGSGKNYGRPLFEFDTLERTEELNLRGDVELRNTQLRLLFKFDPRRRDLFDNEIYFSQVVGCIEPFMVFRQHPHKFFVGIKLPLFDDLQRVSDDIEKRREVISGPKER